MSRVAMYLGSCLFHPSRSRGVSGWGDSYMIVECSLSLHTCTLNSHNEETAAPRTLVVGNGYVFCPCTHTHAWTDDRMHHALAEARVVKYYLAVAALSADEDI